MPEHNGPHISRQQPPPKTQTHRPRLHQSPKLRSPRHPANLTHNTDQTHPTKKREEPINILYLNGLSYLAVDELMDRLVSGLMEVSWTGAGLPEIRRACLVFPQSSI